MLTAENLTYFFNVCSYHKHKKKVVLVSKRITTVFYFRPFLMIKFLFLNNRKKNV